MTTLAQDARTVREALEAALKSVRPYDYGMCESALAAARRIEEAVQQTQEEPVGSVTRDGDVKWLKFPGDMSPGTKLYARAQTRGEDG